MQATLTQRHIERAACIKMAILLALGGLVFAFLPTTASFKNLQVNGFDYKPVILALTNFLGAAVYIWMGTHLELLQETSKLKRVPFLRLFVSAEVLDHDFRPRPLIFFAASLPMFAYIFPLALISLATKATAGGISYFFLYGVVLLVISAVFQGYSKRLERIVLLSLAGYMFVAAYTFSSSPTETLFIFHLPVWVFVVLAGAGGISYVLMLTPLGKKQSIPRRRFWFILSEIVIPTYALFQLGNTLLSGIGAWLVPIALLDMYALIALIHYALYRVENAPSILPSPY